MFHKCYFIDYGTWIGYDIEKNIQNINLHKGMKKHASGGDEQMETGICLTENL